MIAQRWMRWMAMAALVTCGAEICRSKPAPETGSLAGRLTDSSSAPLDNVTITLRNLLTGEETKAITARGGRYRFSKLAAGEYELTAMSAVLQRRLQGIVVSPGHESRVQVALDTQPSGGDVPADVRDEHHDKGSATQSQLRRTIALESQTPAVDIALTTQTLEKLQFHREREPKFDLNHLSETAKQLILDPPAGQNPADSVPVLPIFKSHKNQTPDVLAETAFLLPDITIPELSAPQPALAAIPGRPLSIANGNHTEQSGKGGGEESIDQDQLQSLPSRGRDWQDFVSNLQAAGLRQSGSASPLVVSSEITVDGMPVRKPFNSSGTGEGGTPLELSSPASPEPAIAVLKTPTSVQLPQAFQSIEVETQRGTEHLHGQVFGFDRQSLWNARNPFTRWVKETDPPASGTLPVFTSEPYSPGDREALWGTGIGGVVAKPHLFWFGALDGFDRNHPGVAMVKHPENFFAQPSNDQMQVLSAQLRLGSGDPIGEGLMAYSRLLESLTQLLGPASRSSIQLTAFGRLDWNWRERNRFTVDTTASRLTALGGGLTRASESFGTHSFGSVRAQQEWTLARWDAFVTPNLLVTTAGSFGREVQSAQAESPSVFEESLNVSAWGQLPQIVIDSRNGFTIGNPSRYGRGKYPDEHVYFTQEQFSWVQNKLILRGGAEISHDRDATSQLRNQTGTYYYSSVEDFASDALAFLAFGLSGQLDPMKQHNCDQRGRAWRDSAGVLHGLGYLPCYSYYSQTMGPSNWRLSTNDWAGYITTQIEPTKNIAFTMAMRWELQQLPPAIELLNNPDLALTQRLAAPGNEWGPRAAFAWGTGESRWPVLRLGYGTYFARTANSVVETALTQTGSVKGDLHFFMRPTDNLNAGGAPPFPYVLSGEPATAVKPGATEFAPRFRNGEIHQAEVGLEQNLPSHIKLEVNAVVSLGRRLPVTFDANIDPAANPKTITYLVVDGNGSGPIKSPQITVPFFASWPSVLSSAGFAGRLDPKYQQVSEVFSRANSTYEAGVLRVTRNARSFMLRARYTYGHAMDWNPDETAQLGPSTLDPIDFRQEYGTSSLDVRHSTTAALILRTPWRVKKSFEAQLANGWQLGGVASFRSGLPFSMRTAGTLPKEFNVSGTAIVGLATGMNGYGGDNRVYGVGRNTFRYPATWKADLRLSKRFELGEMRQLELMAESFNFFNHQNVTELETTGYSIQAGAANGELPRLTYLTGLKTGQREFGKPLNINGNDFYRERQIQLGARLRF